jgi:hypothetical protein
MLIHIGRTTRQDGLWPNKCASLWLRGTQPGTVWRLPVSHHQSRQNRINCSSRPRHTTLAFEHQQASSAVAQAICNCFGHLRRRPALSVCVSEHVCPVLEVLWRLRICVLCSILYVHHALVRTWPSTCAMQPSPSGSWAWWSWAMLSAPAACRCGFKSWERHCRWCPSRAYGPLS